jgi:hypothetical protein
MLISGRDYRLKLQFGAWLSLDNGLFGVKIQLVCARETLMIPSNPFLFRV